MSVVYLMGSYHSVFVGPTGHQHQRNDPPFPENVPMAIECPMCEPYLVRDFHGVYDRVQVPLTDRQIAANEQADRQGGAAVHAAAEALARSATVSLNAQLPTSKDELNAMIASAVATALAAQAPEASAKRGPGRPKGSGKKAV